MQPGEKVRKKEVFQGTPLYPARGVPRDLLNSYKFCSQTTLWAIVSRELAVVKRPNLNTAAAYRRRIVGKDWYFIGGQPGGERI